MSACNVSRPTATKWLKSLADKGVLAEIQVGRELLFINRRFMTLLVSDEDIDDDSGVSALF